MSERLKNVIITCVFIVAISVMIAFDVKAMKERARAVRACEPYEMVSIVDEDVICKTADGGTKLKRY